MVSRKLHNKRRRIARKHLCFLEHDAGADDGGHSDEVSRSRNKRGAAEERAGDHRDKRHLCAAGNECCRHNCHTAVSLVFYGSRSHDSGNAAADAARTDEHRDEGFTGEAKLTEYAVKDKSDAGHIAAGLEEREKQEQYEHLRYKAEDGADSGDNTVVDKSAEPVSRADLFKAVADKHRYTGHPYAV